MLSTSGDTVSGRGAALALLTLLAAGCGATERPEPDPTPYFDLVAELALARQDGPAPAAVGEERPRARAEGDTLLIPAGVRVHYPLELPLAARIVFEGVRPRGAESGSLRVVVTPHDAERRSLARLTGERGRTEIEWRAEEPRVVRLSLRAAADGAAMAIRGPAVWAEPGTGTVEEAATLDRRAIRELRGVERPNVLVYLIDSLRADRLGTYGYDKPVSPAIDAFAETALVFDEATANSSWTKSAVASVFTGLWPASHRAISREDKLPADAFTLAEALGEAGYATAGISTNPNITAEFGFEQGFEELTVLGIETRADEVTERATAWLRERRDERPFFLYLHTLDPHDPYLPPAAELERWSPGTNAGFAAGTDKLVSRLNQTLTHRSEVAETAAALEALYDGEIAANDRGFGELLEVLEETGELGDTAIILVADHGEDFGEHGVWRHGSRLTRESLRVPLMIRLPGEHRTGREPSLVQQVDILPTLLELLELEAPRPVEGESLLPLLAGPSRAAADDPAFLHVRSDPPARFGVIWRGWKLVTREGVGTRGNLYRIADDPDERHDLAGRYPVMRDYLQTMLARKLLDRQGALTDEKTEITPETERALRALGYIQ